MVRLDTIKINIPECALEGFDESCFNLSYLVDCDTGEFKRKTYTLKYKNRELGITKLEVKESESEGKKIVCEISAKILKNDYFDLINKNTIEKVTDNLNKLRGIKFNKHLFLDNTTLYRCDCSSNIVVERKITYNDCPFNFTSDGYEAAIHFCKKIYYADSLDSLLNMTGFTSESSGLFLFLSFISPHIEFTDKSKIRIISNKFRESLLKLTVYLSSIIM